MLFSLLAARLLCFLFHNSHAGFPPIHVFWGSVLAIVFFPSPSLFEKRVTRDFQTRLHQSLAMLTHLLFLSHMWDSLFPPPPTFPNCQLQLCWLSRQTWLADPPHVPVSCFPWHCLAVLLPFHCVTVPLTGKNVGFSGPMAASWWTGGRENRRVTYQASGLPGRAEGFDLFFPHLFFGHPTQSHPRTPVSLSRIFILCVSTVWAQYYSLFMQTVCIIVSHLSQVLTQCKTDRHSNCFCHRTSPPVSEFCFLYFVFTFLSLMFVHFPHSVTFQCFSVMSSCHVNGFFTVAKGNHARMNKPFRNPTTTSTAGSPGTWYTYYDTTVTCITQVFLPAQIRVYSPPGEPIFPDETVTFLIGKLSLQAGASRALIDATHIRAIPGDPSDATYEDRVPNFPNSHIDGVGVVSGKHEVLEDRSRVFPVSMSEYVREEVKTFQVM